MKSPCQSSSYHLYWPRSWWPESLKQVWLSLSNAAFDKLSQTWTSLCRIHFCICLDDASASSDDAAPLSWYRKIGKTKIVLILWLQHACHPSQPILAKSPWICEGFAQRPIGLRNWPTQHQCFVRQAGHPNLLMRLLQEPRMDWRCQ